ncbi:hypothetical protein ABID58_006229 [Bradyrhizobium sp. S3.2.6]|uniref:hypothetical protein n=1 Tax=Bradyrhizobium sp. S3.2.6 TaxID=3156428 RepID=UPI003397DD52
MTIFSLLWDLFGWLQSNFGKVVVTLGSCAIVYLLMVGLLRDKRKSDIRSPSSFFSLDEVVSARWFTAISFFFAGSLAILYAALALNAGAFLTDIQHLLVDWLKQKFPAESQAQIKKIFEDDFPSWLEPLSVLGFFLFLFAAKVRKILVVCRDLILNASGLYKILDEAAIDTARELQKKYRGDFDRLAADLKKKFSEAPLPELYAGNEGEMRIAYQVVWLNRKSIRESGLVASLDEFRKRLGIEVSDHGSFRLDLTHLAIASVLFTIFMGVYVVVVPLFHSVVPSYLHWPNPVGQDTWFDVIRYVLKFTLGFVFPLMLALNMYPVRRRAYRREENGLTAFAAVAAIQCIAAFIVFELFNLVDASIAAAQGQQDFSLAYARIHIGAFLYSLVPIVAFGVFLKLRDLGADITLLALITSVAVGVSFGACDLLYECYLPSFDHFYWYQGVLGLAISLAFFVSGSVTEQFGIPNRS